MSFTIVDKRNIGRDRTAENRQRFLKRIRETIKDQMPDLIAKRSLRDMGSDGADIKINRRTITEPTIHTGAGGVVDRVAPGNDRYVEGDLVPKPRNGNGYGGRQAGKGESEDDFVVEISRDEFLKYFFEDLELPNMLANELAKSKETRRENAGYSTDGPPSRLNIFRSYKQSLARKAPLRATINREIAAYEVELAEYLARSAATGLEEYTSLGGCPNPLDNALRGEITRLQEKLASIPMFEDMDLRYRAVVPRDVPSTHATMIMIMDNSGSMGEREKTIARKFFWLLYSFLSREYDEVELKFISHTETAKEMDEYEFFHTRESGGTLVSSALDLASDIIAKDLTPGTNVYVAQVSDGDNAQTDNGTCAEILEDDILPHVRYYAYVQVDDYHDASSRDNDPSVQALMDFAKGLWKTYLKVSSHHHKLQAKRVYQERDIYPVFRDLFSKNQRTHT